RRAQGDEHRKRSDDQPAEHHRLLHRTSSIDLGFVSLSDGTLAEPLRAPSPDKRRGGGRHVPGRVSSAAITAGSWRAPSRRVGAVTANATSVITAPTRHDHKGPPNRTAKNVTIAGTSPNASWRKKRLLYAVPRVAPSRPSRYRVRTVTMPPAI